MFFYFIFSDLCIVQINNKHGEMDNSISKKMKMKSPSTKKEMGGSGKNNRSCYC
jgi:hypothetical protein